MIAVTALSIQPDERNQYALHTVACSVAFGVLGDLLFFNASLGLNILLWTLSLVMCGAILRHRNGLGFTRELAITSTLILFFALGLVWRDSRILRAIDTIGWMLSLALLLWQTRGGTIASTTLFRSLQGLGDAIGSQIAGFIHLISRDVPWTQTYQRKLAGLPAILRGMAVAIPLLIIFGNLFASADPVFEYFTNQLFHWNLENLLNHLMLIGFCTWTAGGPLRALAFDHSQPPHLNTPRRFAAGSIETNIGR